MGVIGLRKFLEGLSCSRHLRPPTSHNPDPSNDSGGSGGPVEVHHVLFDLNSLIHSCYNRVPSASSIEGVKQQKQAIVEMVEFRVEEILREMVMPTISLTLCIDGPASFSKMQTQRLRRRKNSTLSLAASRLFSDLSITAGSPFMVQLENEVARYIQDRYHIMFGNVIRANGGRGPTVFVHGSTAPGEGEAKIAQVLAFLASEGADPYIHRTGKPDPNAGNGRGACYRPDDNIVMVGNDIDLTLTAFGATQYHNLYVLNTSTLQVFCVGEILYRWLLKGTGFVADPNFLFSSRIDVVFLFELNGGDHFMGVGEAAADTVRRYKMLKAQEPHRSIVNTSLQSIDSHFLYDVLQCDQYTGNADVKVGFQLLQAALWSTVMSVTGYCPNYRLSFTTDMLSNPTMSHVKAAVHTKKTVTINFKPTMYTPNVDPSIDPRQQFGERGAGHACNLPLTPLATFTALMPTRDMYPTGVQKALEEAPKSVDRGQALHTVRDLLDYKGSVEVPGRRKIKAEALERETLAKNLVDSHDTPTMALAAEDLVLLAMSQKCLSLAEVRRNAFGSLTCITMNPSAIISGGVARNARAATPNELKRAGFVDDSQARILQLQNKLRTKSGRLPEHIKAKMNKELEALLRSSQPSSPPAAIASDKSAPPSIGGFTQAASEAGKFLFAVKTLDPVDEISPNFSYMTNHRSGSQLRFSSLFQHHDLDVDAALMNDAEINTYVRSNNSHDGGKRVVLVPERTEPEVKRFVHKSAGVKRPRFGDPVDS